MHVQYWLERFSFQVLCDLLQTLGCKHLYVHAGALLFLVGVLSCCRYCGSGGGKLKELFPAVV